MGDKELHFEGIKKTVDCKESRIALINFCDSKSRSHLTLLMTATIAFVGLLAGQFNLFTLNKIVSSVIFIPLIFYFLGRVFFWSSMASQMLIVPVYSQEYIEFLHRISRSKTVYQYSPLIGLNTSAKDANLGWRDYSKINIYRRHLFAAFLPGKGRIIAVLLGVIILEVLLYFDLVFSK